MHVHIDAGGLPELMPRLRSLIVGLEERGFLGKVNSITRAIEGPQRSDAAFVETYRHHTPGPNAWEQFEVFSTSSFGECSQPTDQALDVLKDILDQFAGDRGAVVEVERVAATISTAGEWNQALPALVPSINDEQLGWPRSNTYPIEIHHAFDIRKDQGTSAPPIDIQQLLLDTTELGLELGGWFLFDKGTEWSYRSSQFCSYDDYKDTAQESHAQLQRHLSKVVREWKLWALVEQVMGVWKTGRAHHIDRAVLTVPQIARWEKMCPADGEFWVVAANFLGDRDPDVRDAMKQNLSEGVVYTYFLHTFADVRRLRQLAEDLTAEVGPNVRNQIRAVLFSAESVASSTYGQLLGADYFITTPRSKETQAGYRLRRNSRGHVTTADAMNSRELRRLIDELSPLLEPRIQGVFLPPLLAEPESQRAVMYTDLVGSTERQEHHPAGWERVLEAYDQIVATEVSKFAGEVVKGLGDGYLLVFRQPKDALSCARKLQRRIDEHNAARPVVLIPPQQIAIDYGAVVRAERSHGYDYSPPCQDR